MAGPTYKRIQECMRKGTGIVVKSCWIAHVKEIIGVPMRPAPNRGAGHRKHPCPEHLKNPITHCIIELSKHK